MVEQVADIVEFALSSTSLHLPLAIHRHTNSHLLTRLASARDSSATAASAEESGVSTTTVDSAVASASSSAFESASSVGAEATAS